MGVLPDWASYHLLPYSPVLSSFCFRCRCRQYYRSLRAGYYLERPDHFWELTGPCIPTVCLPEGRGRDKLPRLGVMFPVSNSTGTGLCVPTVTTATATVAAVTRCCWMLHGWAFSILNCCVAQASSSTCVCGFPSCASVTETFAQVLWGCTEPCVNFYYYSYIKYLQYKQLRINTCVVFCSWTSSQYPTPGLKYLLTHAPPVSERPRGKRPPAPPPPPAQVQLGKKMYESNTSYA